jgi:integrase
MTRPKGQITDTEPLTKMEYLLILSHLQDHWRPCAELLWETGIRIGEALAIERKDLENNKVWVTRKKRADKLREQIPISPALFSRLKVLSFAHKDVRLWPFTESGAHLALKLAATKAGLRIVNSQSTIHWHLFRHSFGNRAINTNFGDLTLAAHLNRVQRMMGHVSPNSTLVYTEATGKEVQDGFHKLNE